MNLGKPIAEGNTAKIYLYDNKLIKVFNECLPETESRNEANKQKSAYACGLAVPKIYDVTIINGKQAIIMEYIMGKTLGELLFNNIENAEYYMGISIDIQVDIHMKSAEHFESMDEKLNRQINAADRLKETQKSALVEKLNSMAYEKRLCHGDFHLFNLINNEDKVTIIDWVDSSDGDIRADVYRTYLLYLEHSQELADSYLQLYCKKSGLTKDEIFQWAPIIAGARLSENVKGENSDRLIAIVNSYCP
jgi:tRNA A-37 threonylcarbamoyl transferase component Bud32